MLNLGDIRDIDGINCPAVDVIIGGSPCQDLSIAGSRAGLLGERSGLFAEQLRIVAEMRAATSGRFPRYMVWENVPGALNSNRGRDFLEVLNGCVRISKANIIPVPMPKDGKWPKSGILYDDMGKWSIAWRVHNAQFWGVPQRRRRIALVADFRGQSAGQILFEQKSKRRNKAKDETSRSKDTERSGECLAINGESHESGISVSSISHTLKTSTKELVRFGLGPGCSNNMNPTKDAYTLTCQHDSNMVCYDGRMRENIDCAPTMCTDHNGRVSDYCSLVIKPVIRRLTPLECERLQGYPDEWTDIPGASDSKRYKALGNSIALPFWQHLLNRIIQYCENKTMASLFDGIGGFPLCWLRAGGKTLWISEIDKFCCEVTRHRFG